jgi:predicted dehydrogenase
MAKSASPRTNRRRSGNADAPLRFAVVGAGHIAQEAVLPAFANTRRRCELTCIISSDERKRRTLSKAYGVEHTFDYDDYDGACRAGIFDAVYIALPNSMHREYTERAAAAGIHVLCEKPMAGTSADCAAMIRACRRADVRLMIAYRLHFEKANLEAVRIARSGKLGEPRLFSSVFTMQVKPDNIRLDADLEGGPLMDIGIYCINAARYIFGDEPTEASAFAAASDDRRFKEVPEAVSAVLRFPGERLATITCSFGAAATGWYQVVGTRGDLCVDPAYEYQKGLEHHLTIKDRTKKRMYPKRDQFAPELIAFADCVRSGDDPEPGGAEGMMDVRIIEAIRESARKGRSVKIRPVSDDRPVSPRQQIYRPASRKKAMVKAAPAHAR